MDRARALELLPTSYAIALRLHDAGESDAVIARALDLPVDSIPRLLEIGASKLASVQHSA